jgi:hypothetical protein
MDAEPKSLRPFLLIATAFVVMGSVAGFMTWMLAREREKGRSETTPTEALREVPLHPVPFPDSVPEMERLRLTGLLDGALTSDGKTITPAEQEAAAQGTAIVPPALDRLHSLSIEPGFADPVAKQKVRVLDRILRKIQRRIAPASPPARPPGTGPDPRADLLARAWFRWWEEQSGEVSAGGVPK